MVLGRGNKEVPEDVEIVIVEGGQVSPTVCEELLEGQFDKRKNRCVTTRRKVGEHKSELGSINVKSYDGDASDL